MGTEPKKHHHVYESRWYPKDRDTVRRVCTYPGCLETQEKKVKA